jgi:hypothetical protein
MINSSKDERKRPSINKDIAILVFAVLCRRYRYKIRHAKRKSGFGITAACCVELEMIG